MELNPISIAKTSRCSMNFLRMIETGLLTRYNHDNNQLVRAYRRFTIIMNDAIEGFWKVRLSKLNFILIIYWRVKHYKITAVKADKLLYQSGLTRCVKVMNGIIVKRDIMIPNCPTIILETFSQLNSSLIALLYRLTRPDSIPFYYKHIHQLSYYNVIVKYPNYLWYIFITMKSFPLTNKILI